MPVGMVTPTKEMDPSTTSDGGTEPREEVSSLSSALLTAGAQCGCGELVALTIVRKVTTELEMVRMRSQAVLTDAGDLRDTLFR